MLKVSILHMSLKITDLRLQLRLPGADELNMGKIRRFSSISSPLKIFWTFALKCIMWNEIKYRWKWVKINLNPVNIYF